MTLREKYPTALPKAISVVVAAVALYCVAAVLLSAVNDAQLDACDRGNDSRLSLYIDVREDVATEEALAGQEKDPEVAAIHTETAAHKELRAENMLVAAKNTGFQDSPDVPTISCADAYPEVLPWL